MTTSSSRHSRRVSSHHRYCLIIGIVFILSLYREKKGENENKNEKMKRLINRRCNERSEIIIAIHMYIRCEAEGVARRRYEEGGRGEIENISRHHYWSLRIVIVRLRRLLLL